MLNTQNAVNVVKASTALHNFLLQEDRECYIQPGDIDREDENHGIIPGNWEYNEEKHCLVKLQNNLGNRTGSDSSRSVRDSIASYFQTPTGSVSWQDKFAHVK